MTAKEELRDLIDGIDEAEAAMWIEFLRTGDPVLRTALLAPFDDEEETNEERASVERGRNDYSRSKWKTSEKVRDKLLE